METFKPLQCPQTDVGDDFTIREAYYDPPSFFPGWHDGGHDVIIHSNDSPWRTPSANGIKR